MLACQSCTLTRLVLISSTIWAHFTISQCLLTLLLLFLLFQVRQVYIRRNIAPLIRRRELINFSNTMGYEWLILSTLTLDPVPQIHTVHPTGHSICRCLECRANLSNVNVNGNVNGNLMSAPKSSYLGLLTSFDGASLDFGIINQAVMLPPSYT